MFPLAARYQTFAVVAAVSLVYLGLALSAILLTRLSDNVALLWLGNGLLLAALCTRPARERVPLLIGCAIASFIATSMVSPYWPLAIAFVVANCGEAMIACWLLGRMGESRGLFKTIRSIPVFVLAAGLIAPAVSGLIPLTFLWLIKGASPLFTLSNWLIGHGLGVLIGTPVALLALGGRDYLEGLTQRRARSGFALAIGFVIVVTVATFHQSVLPLLFLPVLPLVVATMTYRFAGAALSVFVIATVGALYTIFGLGPVQLMAGSDAAHLMFFQFYLAVLFLIALPCATMMSENRRLAEAVAASEARYRMIADHASDVMLTMDPDGTIRFASPSVRDLSGHEPAALVGRNALMMVCVDDRDRVRANHAAALQSPEQPHRVEYRGLHVNGTQRWLESTSRAVAGEDGQVISVVSMVHDLSQRKAREADLERQAATDPMTGVLNRRAFQRRLADLPRTATGTAGVLALLDLDHFKSVNDRWGHATGDAALLTFADVMRANLRGEDAIGRLGGEEFAILFPGLHSVDALAACERLRQSLEEQDIARPGGAFRITVSIGIAPVSGSATPEAIFRQADAALYRAKSLGRNRSELADS